MRTRSRTTTINLASTSCKKEEYAGVVINGAFGPRVCRPIQKIGEVAVADTSGPAWRTNVETIIDDNVSVGRQVKPVTHTKRTCPVFEGVNHFSNQGVFTARRSYGDILPEYVGRYHYIGTYDPGYYAWMQSAYMIMDPYTGTYTSMGMGTLTDRLAELPARVVKRLESLHSTTIAYEALELPDVFRMFKLRGGLLGRTETLLRSLRYGSKSFAKNMTQLVKLYSEGHLGTCFGIMPTISDARKISEQLVKGLKARRKQFTVTLRGSNERLSGAIYPSSGYNANYGTARREEDASYLRVDGARVTEVRPQYLNPAFQNFIDRTIGVNGGGIIWEILPMSFAVDWLLSVDNALDTLWLNYQNQYNVEYWTSSKYYYQKAVYYKRCSGFNPQTSAPIWSAVPRPLVSTYTYYNRTLRAAPSALSSLQCRGANTYNLFLSALIALGLKR